MKKKLMILASSLIVLSVTLLSGCLPVLAHNTSMKSKIARHLKEEYNEDFVILNRMAYNMDSVQASPKSDTNFVFEVWSLGVTKDYNIWKDETSYLSSYEAYKKALIPSSEFMRNSGYDAYVTAKFNENLMDKERISFNDCLYTDDSITIYVAVNCNKSISGSDLYELSRLFFDKYEHGDEFDVTTVFYLIESSKYKSAIKEAKEEYAMDSDLNYLRVRDMEFTDRLNITYKGNNETPEITYVPSYNHDGSHNYYIEWSVYELVNSEL